MANRRNRTRKKVTPSTLSERVSVNRETIKDKQTHGSVETEEEPALISVSQKVTLMPQEYQPVQVQIGVTIPCEANPDSIDKAIEWASEKVDQKLQEEIERALSDA